MFSFFKKNQLEDIFFGSSFKTDMHSHLLPGIDDGAKDLDQSLTLIKELILSGYEKLITTPHIMSDFYKNTPEIISNKLIELQEHLSENNINIKIDAAAEYFLDEWLMERIRQNEKLLTFGDNFILFETSFINKSSFLLEAIFLMQTQNYKPVLAHPERYIYFHNDFQSIKNLYDKNVFLQININSLTGYYGKEAKTIAEKLIDNKMVSFAGTDCHAEKHILSLQKVYKSKYYEKLVDLPLYNKTL